MFNEEVATESTLCGSQWLPFSVLAVALLRVKPELSIATAVIQCHSITNFLYKYFCFPIELRFWFIKGKVDDFL